jgi:hypothetical protein
MRSDDAGLTWSEPREIAHTHGRSDHPQLLARGADVFLSWFTVEDGYRIALVR